MMRLEDPEAVYAALVALQVGDAVPARLYIHDYEDGQVPDWVLIWREALGADGLALIFEDRTPQLGSLVLLPRCGVLTFPSKTLATREYLCDVLEWRCPRGMLCSLLQQAHIVNRRQANKEVA